MLGSVRPRIDDCLNNRQSAGGLSRSDSLLHLRNGFADLAIRAKRLGYFGDVRIREVHRVVRQPATLLRHGNERQGAVAQDNNDEGQLESAPISLRVQ